MSTLINNLSCENNLNIFAPTTIDISGQDVSIRGNVNIGALDKTTSILGNVNLGSTTASGLKVGIN